MRYPVIPALTLLASLSCALPAWAHAYPQKTAPKAGAVLKTAPKEVDIWFDDALQPGVNRIDVLRNGKLVSIGHGMLMGKELMVSLKQGGAGR